eukprot:5069620-Prymnesium_polylepis.1
MWHAVLPAANYACRLAPGNPQAEGATWGSPDACGVARGMPSASHPRASHPRTARWRCWPSRPARLPKALARVPTYCLSSPPPSLVLSKSFWT